MTKYTLIFLLASTFISSVFVESATATASPILEIQQSVTKIRKQYLNFLSGFNDQFCTPQAKTTFSRLAKKRKELDVYVPELQSGEPDLSTVQKNLVEVENKWDWLIQVRHRLKKEKNLPSIKLLSTLERRIDDLVELKKKHFLLGKKSADIRKKSQDLLNQLQKDYESMLEKLYFLKGFDYPVDHLKQRQAYENLKTKNRQKANQVMFVRQLQEDGTFDPDNHRHQDIYLRTTLNSISLMLQKEGPWISENLRHDLEWAIRNIKNQLRWERSRQLKRIQAWINRMAYVRQFYKNLLNPKNGQAERQKIRQKQEAGLKLKNFVYSTNAKVYKALLRESELTQALYVFDQILLHEAGEASNDNFRDRKDVAQVIINSRRLERLSTISPNETFHDFLLKEGVSAKVMAQSSWLNVMFKELRFSFTLYFIPAVKHIFCPDFYRTARTTRSKNIYLAVQQLKSPKDEFKALRYFSRWSMIGRVDMSQVWEGFRRIPERVGARYKSQNHLRRAFKKGNYKYFYSFRDPQQAQYHVISIKNKKYAITDQLKEPTFHAYRDAHRFRFFEPE